MREERADKEIGGGGEHETGGKGVWDCACEDMGRGHLPASCTTRWVSVLTNHKHANRGFLQVNTVIMSVLFLK